jgi:hypothetical protein
MKCLLSHGDRKKLHVEVMMERFLSAATERAMTVWLLLVFCCFATSL